MTTPPDPSWPPESGRQPPHHPGTYGNPPAQRSTNELAIASLVLGIVGIPFVLPSLGIVVFLVPAILALVFGYVARKQITQRGQDGAGMAKAGIVLGSVAIGLYVIFIIIGFFV